MANSFVRLLKALVLPGVEKEMALRRLLHALAEADYHQSPPALAGEMHRVIRAILKKPDPYENIKAKWNRVIMDCYPDFQQIVRKAEDPFYAAMRLAVAANVIDFGSEQQLDFMNTIDRGIHARLAIDDSPQLKGDVNSANTVLYVGDNCGEIVLDRLFIETMNHSNVYYAVRGGPVINDATLKDAKDVGMDQVAEVITTGDDSPGAVWEKTNSAFQQVFKKADLVISKGQGNLEGLIEVEQNSYFLLVTKCHLIAEHLREETEAFIVGWRPNLAALVTQSNARKDSNRRQRSL
jgi:uncharacterized protein with ATP-grasp and redox domains